ncbi:hypothetical protein ACP4OV_003598 [Aristida adscensionis]
MRPAARAATPQGSPAPAAPAPAPSPRPKASAGKRPRKAVAAAPLSDVTNLPLLPETPTPTRPRRTGPRRALPAPSDASSSACSSSASVTPAPAMPPSAAPVTPAPAKTPSAAVLEEQRSVVRSAISTVYVRRGAGEAEGGRRNPGASKGKAPAAAAAAATGTASCPPLGKSTRSSSRSTSVTKDRPVSSSAPCHEAKKKRHTMDASTTPKLPEDFVKKQRAYFADIDAFELSEEEVSETDLE